MLDNIIIQLKLRTVWSWPEKKIMSFGKKTIFRLEWIPSRTVRL